MDTIEIWKFIFVGAALNGFFVTVGLFRSKKGSRAANQILALLIFIISIICLDYFLTITGLYKTYPHFIYSSAVLWFLVGPLIYLYVSKQLNPKKKFSYLHLLHFVPALIALTQISRFYLLSGEAKLNYFEQTLLNSQDGAGLWDLSYAVLIIIYVAVSYYKVKKYEENYKEKFAGGHLVHVHWLKYLFAVFTTYLFIDFIFANIVSYLGYSDVLNIYANISLLIISTSIFAIGFLSLNFPETLFPEIEREESKPKEKTSKYDTSALSDEKKKEYLNTITLVMENEKPYLNDELKLKDLSELTGISTHNISQVLNQELDSKFYDFINRHRIKEAKKLLIDPEYSNYSILSIALEVGFSNSASFYRAFKKFTNQTPTGYLNSQKITTA